MVTQPRLPAGEEPLDRATVERVLSHLGPDLVLVGGQALAFWMARFGIEAQGVAITNDGDAVGTLPAAEQLAEAIGARIERRRRTALTALVAQLRLPAHEGHEHNIDVLHQLYAVGGVRKAVTFTRRVIADSVRVEWRPGCFIRIMDPFDLLESRAHNAVGLLEDKGPHTLTQARWAIEVAREALLRMAAAPEIAGRLGQRLRGIVTLDRSQVGRRLRGTHGIDLLNVVDLDALSRMAPDHRPQLEAIARVRSRRA